MIQLICLLSMNQLINKKKNIIIFIKSYTKEYNFWVFICGLLLLWFVNYYKRAMLTHCTSTCCSCKFLSSPKKCTPNKKTKYCLSTTPILINVFFSLVLPRIIKKTGGMDLTLLWKFEYKHLEPIS